MGEWGKGGRGDGLGAVIEFGPPTIWGELAIVGVAARLSK